MNSVSQSVLFYIAVVVDFLGSWDLLPFDFHLSSASHTFEITAEPWLSKLHGRHTIGSDKQEVWIDGVASEPEIGRVLGKKCPIRCLGVLPLVYMLGMQ